MSIKKLKDFIEKVENSVDDNCTLWFSMQANVTADLASTQKSFGVHLQQLKEHLTKNRYVLPRFNANMRNSHPISSIKISQEGDYACSMGDDIEKLVSSVSGETPLWILLKKNDMKQKLETAFKDAIQAWNKNNATDLVVLYDGECFTSDQVRKTLMKVTNKTIHVYDPETLGEESSEQHLKNFVSNENGEILVTAQELFTGCESPHIILLENDYSLNSVRCALLRAVAHLTLILTVVPKGLYKKRHDVYK